MVSQSGLWSTSITVCRFKPIIGSAQIQFSLAVRRSRAIHRLSFTLTGSWKFRDVHHHCFGSDCQLGFEIAFGGNGNTDRMCPVRVRCSCSLRHAFQRLEVSLIRAHSSSLRLRIHSPSWAGSMPTSGVPANTESASWSSRYMARHSVHDRASMTKSYQPWVWQWAI